MTNEKKGYGDVLRKGSNPPPPGSGHNANTNPPPTQSKPTPPPNPPPTRK